MQFQKVFIATSASVALFGCATSLHSPKLEATDDTCRGYGTYVASPLFQSVAQEYEAELIRRGLLTDDEWELVRAKKIKLILQNKSQTC